MNQPIIIAITQDQYNALEKMRVEFAELKHKVSLLENKPTVEWVRKAYLQQHRTLGVKDLRAVTARLEVLVKEKHIRQQGNTFNLNDILLFNKKTQAA